jgi:hypothetical protein
MEGSKFSDPWNVPYLVAFEMNPMLGGQWGNILLGDLWNVPYLVAFEMNLMLGGQWGNILLGGPWNVPYLVAFGRRRRSILFMSFHFSPHKILLKHFFSLILKFCFTIVLYHYFMFFFHLP